MVSDAIIGGAILVIALAFIMMEAGSTNQRRGRREPAENTTRVVHEVRDERSGNQSRGSRGGGGNMDQAVDNMQDYEDRVFGEK